MQNGPFEFIWEAPTQGDGYEWVQRDSGFPDKVLSKRQGASFRTYALLREETGLFRVFGDTEPTPEGILAFANRYGLLGVPDDPSFPDDPAESFFCWRLRILMMRQLIALWGLLAKERREDLRRVIRWEGNGAVIYVPPPEVGAYYAEMDDPLLRIQPVQKRNTAGFEVPPDLKYFGEIGSPWDGSQVIASRTRFPDQFAHYVPGDLLRPARDHLVNVLGYCIERGKVKPTLLWGGRSASFVYQDLPGNLYGAVHHQLALSIYGNRRYNQCRVCRRWFEVARGREQGISRTDRETCSNACRVRSYRERQEAARRLHAAGKSFKEIAKELGSKVATVKTWVAKKKR